MSRTAGRFTRPTGCRGCRLLAAEPIQLARFMHRFLCTLFGLMLYSSEPAMYLGLYPVTTTTVTTHIIVTTNLLTLNNVELEEQVEAELAENPALERLDSQRCSRCGAIIERPPCPACMKELLAGHMLHVESSPRQGSSEGSWDDDYDPMQALAQPTRLADHILAQLAPQIETRAVPIALYLAESLDERGFLAVPVAQVATALGVTAVEVESILHIMQMVDPVGVGSRNPQECLLRQLEALTDDAGAGEGQNGEEARHVAHRIVAEFWDPFLHARWSEIPIPSNQASAALAFIRANLTPYPALADWEGELARRQGPAEPTVYTRPDMAIYLDSDGNLAVEIFSIRSNWLRISPSFREMMRLANGNGQEAWTEMAERARLFIKCLGQRHQTLRRAVESLVSHQEQAIRHGDAFMLPLTRTQLAQTLGVHEATVSRAIMGKTAALPDGRIVPLSHFFESGKSTKEVIRQMIADEHEPLSDSAIAVRLQEIGQPIARRTVAKYRNMLGILPVHLRARQREQAVA
jgi:RNA polymerase sigma-54 factor